jgi:hypothetical protein
MSDYRSTLVLEENKQKTPIDINDMKGGIKITDKVKSTIVLDTKPVEKPKVSSLPLAIESSMKIEILSLQEGDKKKNLKSTLPK